MNKKAHKIGGVIAASLTLAIIDLPILESIELTIGVMFGTILPDIDADYSYFNSKFKIVSKIYKLIPNNNIIFRHRGLLFHSFYTILLLSILYTRYNYKWILGIIIGVFSHHLLDMLTPARLPNYFYPITKGDR